MNQEKFHIQQLYFTKTNIKTFSSKEYYQIILIGKGDGYFTFNEKEFYCNAETAVFLKPGECVSLHYLHSKYPLELFYIEVLPEYLKELSDDTCELEESYATLPFAKSIIHLDTRDTTLIKNIAKSILTVSQNDSDLGHQLYLKNMQSILLILLLRSCVAFEHVSTARKRKNLVMDDIFRYIREHLTEDLSLEVLEEQFYVSRHHLCREFKKMTGQTIHSYILKSRLNLCKKYIEEGKPIKEVYILGGFGGYQHFFRAFKKEYGMTPKEYYKSLVE